MSRGTVAVVGLLALLWFGSVAAAPTETTILVSTPIAFSGVLEATSDDAEILYGGAGTVDVTFTAERVYASVTRIVRDVRDATGAPDPNGPASGTDPPLVLDEVQVHLAAPTADLIAHLFNGPFDNGRYTYSPGAGSGGRAETLLTVNREPVFVRTDAGSTLDHNATIEPAAFKLWSRDASARAEGNFTAFFYGTTVALVGRDAVEDIRTGTWTEEERPASGVPVVGDVAPPTRTYEVTQFVLLEAVGAVFEARDSGALQGFFSRPTVDLAMTLDGTLRASGASGTVRLGEETLVPSDETVTMEGTMEIQALEGSSGSGDALLRVQGDVVSAIVGPTQYDYTEVAVASAAAVAAAAAVAWFWPSIKFGALVPLYAKLSKDKLLNQETRGAVYGKVEQDPGVQVKQVAEALGVSWTTAAYHLRVLRKMGLLTSTRQGRYEHFFLNGVRTPLPKDAMSLLQNATARQILELVMKNPGIIQKDLSARLGIVPSTVNWHITRLKDVELLREERDWRMHRYYAGGAAGELAVTIG